MWKKIIHIVEHLHLKKLPLSSFSWGTEYVTNTTVRSPAEFISSWVRESLQNSDNFFAYEPVKDFKQLGNVLTFTTPLTYPHQAQSNRIAYAKVYGKDSSRRGVIVVPHWNASPDSYVSLCKALALFGFKVVRLTLPYHQERGVADWEQNNDFVSANIARTIQSVRQAVVEVRALAHWLKMQGCENVGVFGSSIGSCIAIIADAHDNNINSMFTVHMSSWFGDVVWTGNSTQHIKLGLESHMNQNTLRELWSVISPLPYIHRFAGGNPPSHFILSGSLDITFPYHLTDLVFQEYDRYHIQYRKKVLPAGHFTFRYAPFSYLVFYLILKHFKNTL